MNYILTGGPYKVGLLERLTLLLKLVFLASVHRRHWQLPQESPGDWAESPSPYRKGPNCYSFALGQTSECITPGHLAWTLRGDKRGRSVTTGSYPVSLALLELDGLTPVTKTAQLNGASYPVLLFTKENDYHFIRPDSIGGWWHKPGDFYARRKRWPLYYHGYSLCGIFLVDTAVIFGVELPHISPLAEKILQTLQ